MQRVRGIVQHYAWGHETALPHLMGLAPDGRPWAEVWFGTHPAGPSTVAPADRSASTPASSLQSVAGSLPYMVKLLAAAAPLSLQTHPSATQAAQGYAAESAVPPAERLYADPFAKPELMVALSPFRALCGVRPPEATASILRGIGGAAAALADRLERSGVAAVISEHLMDGRPVDDIVAACRARPDRPEAALVAALDDRHPADPAAALSLLLNLVDLRAGEGLYLTPGNLHAYLEGTGVEVMGSSDNVIRGGLTNKKVDVEELMRVLDPAPLAEPVVRPRRCGTATWVYDTPGAPFTVTAQHVTDSCTLRAEGRELVLCTSGSTDVLQPGDVAYLAPGDRLTLTGTATLFRTTDAV